MHTIITWLAEASPSGGDSHTLEWWLIWSTVVLALVTLATAIVTGLQTWISWKTYKVESEKTNNAINKSSDVSEHAIDGMEHVAVVAITHNERVRQMKHIRKGKGV
jgi:hypothetical protein